MRIPWVLNVSLINIGQLYLEKILKNNSDDYVCFKSSAFGGLFVANHVVSKEYALMKGWITAGEELAPVQLTGELSSESSNTTITTRPMTANSLLRGSIYPITARRSVDPKPVVEMTEVVESTDFGDNRLSYGDVYASRNHIDDVNMPSSGNRIIADTSKSKALNPLVNMSKPTQVEEEEDATLFQLYQNEVSRVSDGGTEEMSFEEWKIKRKQFSPNTRKTFISSYRVFEDLEEVSQQRKDYMNRFKKGAKK